jgi:hypothetical protein
MPRTAVNVLNNNDFTIEDDFNGVFYTFAPGRLPSQARSISQFAWPNAKIYRFGSDQDARLPRVWRECITTERFTRARDSRSGPSGSARRRSREPPCLRQAGASQDYDVGVRRHSRPVSGERPNTDCRNMPTSAWRAFLPVEFPV